MTEKQETLGLRLRRLREALGLSQEELAHRAGLPLVSYRNWEYDHRLPGLGAASLLAKALQVPLQQLADCVEGQEDRRHRPRSRKGTTSKRRGPAAKRQEEGKRRRGPRKVGDGPAE